jgi:hypothetical protein
MKILGLEEPFSHTQCNSRYAHLLKANSATGRDLAGQLKLTHSQEALCTSSIKLC